MVVEVAVPRVEGKTWDWSDDSEGLNAGRVGAGMR